MEDARESVMIRVTASTLADVDAFASRLGISRNAAFVVLVDRALGHSPDTEWARLDHVLPLERVKVRVERVVRRSDGAWESWGKIRRQLTQGDREHFSDAVDELVNEGRLARRVDRGTTYLAQAPRAGNPPDTDERACT